MNLSPDACNASINAVVSLIDRDGAPGSLRILDDRALVICSIELGFPAFSAAVDGVATATGLPLSGVGTLEAGTGFAPARFQVTDASGRVIWEGTVPGDMTIDRATIGANQPINISEWDYIQPTG